MSSEVVDMVQDLKKTRAAKKKQCIDRNQAVDKAIDNEMANECPCDFEDELIPEAIATVSNIKKKIKIRNNNAGKEAKIS